MNKMKYGLTQLLNELQTFESIQRMGKKLGSVNITNKASTSRANPRKRKGAAQRGKGQGQARSSKGKGPALGVQKKIHKRDKKGKKPANANSTYRKGKVFPL